MATRYRFGDNTKPHFITSSVINWIDVFNRECYKQVLLDSLEFCIKEKGLILHAWIIMSNHVHLIASAKEGFVLAAIIRDFKKFTSRNLLKVLNPMHKKAGKNGCYGCLSGQVQK